MQMASCGWKTGRRRPSIDDYGYQYKAVMSGGPAPRRWLSLHWKQPYVVFLFTGAVVLGILVYFFVFKFLGEQTCLPAPYLYVTGHNSENIFKYSRDGCHLESRVVWYGSERPYQLRGMATGIYKGHEVIFAAQVSDSNDVYDRTHPPSNIIIVGPCSGFSRKRPYITSINAGRFNSYHAYSVAMDDNNNVYASFQHTDGVVRFSAETLEPLPSPKTLETMQNNGNQYINVFKKKFLGDLPNGTFVQFGRPGIHNVTEQGIRSIAWVPVNFTRNDPSAAAAGAATITNSASNPTAYPTNSPVAATVSARPTSTSTSTTTLRNSKPPTNSNINIASQQPTSHQSTNSKRLLSNTAEDGSVIVDPLLDTKPVSIPLHYYEANRGNQYLWIANEDYNRVFIVDKDAKEVGWIRIQNPVGMFYDSTRGIVFVGSKSKKATGGGAVYGIDINTWSVVKTFQLLGKVGLVHPTGLLVYEDILYVAEQTSNLILAFNVTTQRFLSNVVSSFPDDVEQITLSYC